MPTPPIHVNQSVATRRKVSRRGMRNIYATLVANPNVLRDHPGLYLRTGAVALLLGGVSRDQVRLWLTQGYLASAVTPGGQYRIPVDSLRALAATLNLTLDEELIAQHARVFLPTAIGRGLRVRVFLPGATGRCPPRVGY